MSLILEALRKSEAERQRGRSPGLFVEQRPASARERRVPAWAIALGALLVAVLLAWGWREWRRPAVIVVTEAQLMQPAPRAEPAPPAPGPLAPITLAPAPVVAPAPEVAAPPPPPPTAAATPAAPPPAPLPAPIAEPTPAAAPPSEPVAALPGLAALAASDRAGLPPLKLSMHVYADSPAQRFVILDGQRLGEGASPANGVVLEEIRRDGLVLSVNGQRLLLARP